MNFLSMASAMDLEVAKFQFFFLAHVKTRYTLPSDIVEEVCLRIGLTPGFFESVQMSMFCVRVATVNTSRSSFHWTNVYPNTNVCGCSINKIICKTKPRIAINHLHYNTEAPLRSGVIWDIKINEDWTEPESSNVLCGTKVVLESNP